MCLCFILVCDGRWIKNQHSDQDCVGQVVCCKNDVKNAVNLVFEFVV